VEGGADGHGNLLVIRMKTFRAEAIVAGARAMAPTFPGPPSPMRQSSNLRARRAAGERLSGRL
jgi:hypothetical protein